VVSDGMESFVPPVERLLEGSRAQLSEGMNPYMSMSAWVMRAHASEAKRRTPIAHFPLKDVIKKDMSSPFRGQSDCHILCSGPFKPNIWFLYLIRTERWDDSWKVLSSGFVCVCVPLCGCIDYSSLINQLRFWHLPAQQYAHSRQPPQVLSGVGQLGMVSTRSITCRHFCGLWRGTYI
jgi:hypothetical protein